jgi:dTDP-4-amino-4,6-dideoxygalactose transaminase
MNSKNKAKTVPRRDVPIGFADIGELEQKYVLEVLKSKRLSYGPFSRRFESEFAAAHASKYAVMCNSGTSALRVSIAAAKEKFKWKDGDEVLVPAVTFVATSNVLLQQNLKPVFVDVDPLTYNLNPAEVEKHITKRTRGIMPVHLSGLPCDMEPLMELKHGHKLAMIEDSCETMFSKYKGKPVGSFGEFGCFSTYVAHILVTGVGGLALTSDPELAVMLRSLCNHGRDGIYLSIDDDDKAKGAELDMIMKKRFSFVRLGYSFRATELEAALACAQFERKDEILAKRKKNALFLSSALSDLQDVLQLPHIPAGSEHAFMFYPLLLTSKAHKRDDLTLFLEEAGIETRYLLPLINQPIYRKLFGNLDAKYPVAADINANAFYVGCHQHLSQEDLQHISDVVHAFFGK